MKLVAFLFCLGLLACQPASQASAPLRFVDRFPAEQRTELDIDGDTRAILPAGGLEQRIPVTGAPERPVLTFAAGLRPIEEAGVMRFELLLAPKQGDPVSLYNQELDRMGWSEAQIDLADRDLDGASLVFRRTVVSGFESQLPLSGWGNPILQPAQRSTRPSVILISLDTLQADRLGSYGYPGARTSALDRLAAEGVLFERTYAPSTWTVPSHASLFYGAYLAFTPATMKGLDIPPGSEGVPTAPIATLLRDAGFLTAGFTGGGFLGFPWEFSRGFDAYFAYQQPGESKEACHPQRFDGAEVFQRATAWLRQNRNAPFFLFVHTYDVHDRCPFLVTELGKHLADWPDLEPERRAELHRYYDDLIGQTDRKLAGFLAVVDELGLREDTLLVVTSDHGEVLTENRVNGHGCNWKRYNRDVRVPLPYEELTKVPLLVRFPGRVPAGERVATPVSLIDIPTTILALLGIPRDPKMQGKNLPGLGLPGARGPSEAIYSHCGEELSVWRGRHKLITSLDARHPDEFYDVAEDPNERRPLAHTDPEFDVLTADAAEFWERTPSRPGAPPPRGREPKLDAAAERRLRALGYVE